MVPSQSVGTFEYEAVLLVLPVGEEGEPGVDTSIIWIEFTRSRSSPADPGTRRLVLKFLRWSILPQKLRLVFSKLWGTRFFMQLTPATRVSPCSCPSSSAFVACRSISSCGRCLSDRPKMFFSIIFSFKSSHIQLSPQYSQRGWNVQEHNPGHPDEEQVPNVSWWVFAVLTPT